MHNYAAVVSVLLLAAASRVAGHPLCYVDDKPTDLEQVMTFCPQQQDGACCNDMEEAEIRSRYENKTAIIPDLSTECADLYKEVVCGQCHSYSNHLLGRLGPTYGVGDALTMKSSFCTSFVDACTPYMTFPTYDGKSYCEHHTGGGTDMFWSYPYTEPEIFAPGLKEVFPGADFPSQTISMKQSPDGSQYWLMGQAGHIKRVDATDMSTAVTVVDIDGPTEGGDFYLAYEEGLLDFAFGPMFGLNEIGYPDYFYLSYTMKPPDALQRNRLSRFTYIAGDPVATRASEEVLLTTISKYSSIHSAGWVDFKPSSFGKMSPQDIYWATGDGGPQTDPLNRGQDDSNLLAAIVRITVPSTAGATGYTIPAGNHVGGGAAPEVCASGLRNPFRCGFDIANDVLYCGDVGHTNVEEIDIIECGKNYGWSRFEGSRCQEAVEDNEFNPPCAGSSRSGFEFPFFEYCHPDYSSTVAAEAEFTGGYNLCGSRQVLGHCVIGGYVYRGEYFADLLDGAYIFGDNTNRNVYYLKDVEGQLTVGTIVSDASVQIISFAQDLGGEIMLITSTGIYQLPCGDLCATTCLDQAEEPPTLTYLGCYIDRSQRVLPIRPGVCQVGESAMSPAICASYCASIGAAFAGVEYGNECFCGNSGADYGKYGKRSDQQCGLPCSANPDLTCGGNNRIEVYKLGAPAPTDDPDDPFDPPDTFSYEGCFADSTSPPRIMTFGGGNSKSTMSAAICSGMCGNSAYFGTQYSYECWCSVDANLSAITVNGDGTCDSPCKGNTNEICGGYYAVSVYKRDGGGATPSPSPVTPQPSAPVAPAAPVTPQPSAPVAPAAPVTPQPSAPVAPAAPVTPQPSAPVAPAAPVTPQPSAPVAPAAPVAPVSPTEYLGCYGDKRRGRVFDPVLLNDTPSAGNPGMTVEKCKGLCPDVPFYALQYGIECWCGSNPDYAKYGSSEDTAGVVCDMTCAGDTSEICGGYYAMSVYSNGSL